MKCSQLVGAFNARKQAYGLRFSSMKDIYAALAIFERFWREGLSASST